MRQHGINAGGVVGLVVAVWLIYLAIEVARHVHAWPFN
jgi:uncharacterized membrane protein